MCASSHKVFSGESICSKKDCNRKAYYRSAGLIFCGYHADRNRRVHLQHNPNRRVQRDALLHEHRATIEQAAVQNRARGRRGRLTCCKMRMMQNPELVAGWQLVFPNNRHGVRADGLGCPSLSPMRLGPVEHRQPGLPDALSIENYHQYNKHFPQFESLHQFRELRTKAYCDPVPHRHKYASAKIKAANKQFVNGLNVPACSVHLDAGGHERRYSYLESRFFYCYWYERLAKGEMAFAELVKKLDDGVNLRIVGYDAYEPCTRGNIYTDYCDSTRPFGHEMVLYALLACKDSQEYPWWRFYREHRIKYDPVSFLDSASGVQKTDESIADSFTISDACLFKMFETVWNYIPEDEKVLHRNTMKSAISRILRGL